MHRVLENTFILKSMRTQKLTFLILFLGLLHFPQVALAQTDGTTLLEEIQKAYNDLNYTEAEIKAKSALEKYQNFTSSQLTAVHKILGLLYYSQNKPTESRRQFEIAFSLNPELKLDPLFVSPKILEFYNHIKAEWQLSKQQNSDIQNQIRYVLVNDPRPAAALRSMILPGWGQVYKGEKRKGLIFFGLWSLGIAGSVITHFARQDAEDKYLSETNPAQINSRFDSFNKFHKLRNNLLFFSAGVWLFSYIDAILKNRPAEVESSGHQKRVSITTAISPDYASLQFQFKL